MVFGQCGEVGRIMILAMLCCVFVCLSFALCILTGADAFEDVLFGGVPFDLGGMHRTELLRMYGVNKVLNEIAVVL